MVFHDKDTTVAKPSYLYNENFCAVKAACLYRNGAKTMGPLLLPKISISIGIKEWISNYIHVKQCDVITHACPNINGDTLGRGMGE